MNSVTILAALVLLCCFQYGEPLPLQGSPSSTDDLDHEEFMARHGVTQEEVEEFHRANGYAVPSDEEEDAQSRSLGTMVGALKFWNWTAFNKFRQWIQERRSRTTTLAPIPVYIVDNPHKPYYYPNRY